MSAYEFEKGRNHMKRILCSALFLLFLISAKVCLAWPSWPECPDLNSSDFRTVTLATVQDIREPLKMAFDMDDAGNVNIYVIERRGALKYYDALAKSIVLLDSVPDVYWIPIGGTGGQYQPSNGNNEDGLVGVALDPRFKANRWIFFYHSTVDDWRVVRYTLTGENRLDRGSLKTVIRIPRERDHWHTGGALAFDYYGDLWITTGDNSHSDVSAGNTNDLRGAILRIHPESDGSYTVPAGNLRDMIREEMDLTEDDLNKVRPEIYAMGTRNAYTITLDPVRRWMTYGDCGPDGWGTVTEEWNLTTGPGNMGWPYYAGEQVITGINYPSYGDVDDHPNNDNTRSSPVNLSPENSGLLELPPVAEPAYSEHQKCAMTGPIYRYDGSLKSQVKMPPHFDGKWLITDYNQSFIKVLTLNDENGEVQNAEEVFREQRPHSPLDFQVGPDGAFYFVNYGTAYYNSTYLTGLTKIVYTGDCRPEEPVPEKAGCADPGYEEYDAAIPEAYHDSLSCMTQVSRVEKNSVYAVDKIRYSNSELIISLPGEYTVQIFDINGRIAASFRGAGERSYPLNFSPGMYLVRAETRSGVLQSKIFLL
jgi:cytochrome c